MTVSIVLEFAAVLAAIWMGARTSGLGLGLWGAVGLLVLIVVFGVSTTSPLIDVMLIILAVIMAATRQAASTSWCRSPGRIIRANPKYVRDACLLTSAPYRRLRYRPLLGGS